MGLDRSDAVAAVEVAGEMGRSAPVAGVGLEPEAVSSS